MDFGQILEMLKPLAPWVGTVLKILGALVVIGMAIVAATPSLEDDKRVEKIMAFPFIGPLLIALSNFSPFQKKLPEQK